MRAASIKIESDEDGFHLIIDTDLAVEEFDFLIDEPEALYQVVLREIGPWLAEMNAAREADLGDVRAFEIADESGYELSNPKHPEFHSIHADIWDAREKG